MTNDKSSDATAKTSAVEKVRNPTTHFDQPDDVVTTENLSRPQKEKALKNWEEDARRLAVATEEGMGGGEPSRATEVAEAQSALGVKSRESKSPAKAG